MLFFWWLGEVKDEAWPTPSPSAETDVDEPAHRPIPRPAPRARLRRRAARPRVVRKQLCAVRHSIGAIYYVYMWYMIPSWCHSHRLIRTDRKVLWGSVWQVRPMRACTSDGGRAHVLFALRACSPVEVWGLSNYAPDYSHWNCLGALGAPAPAAVGDVVAGQGHARRESHSAVPVRARDEVPEQS